MGKSEVFDDDGKAGPDGRDKLIGVGFFGLKQLEAANTVQSPLEIKDGHSGKSRGQIMVRTFKVQQGGSGGQMNNYPGQNPGQGYPGQGYPPAMPGYPGQGAQMP